MRIVFKTSYDADIGLFAHRYQAFWYFLLLAAAVGLPFAIDDFWIGEVALMLIWSIAGMGLMLLVGHVGQPSLGHAAFMAVGAYTNVILQTSLGWPFLVSFPLSGCAAALAGALLALPTARLHGIYLAIATLAVSVLAEDGIVMLAPWTGGVSGIVAPDIKIFGTGFNRYVNAPGFYWLTLGVAVLVALGYRNILRSPLGRSIVAVRDSEISAQAIGVNLAWTKAVSFALSCGVTGLAGALMGHFAGVFNHETFTIFLSITLLMMIVIGGLGSIHGAFLGAIVITFLPLAISIVREFLNESFGVASVMPPGIETAAFGAILIAFILLEPMGIYGRWVKIRTYFELFPFCRRDMFRRQRGYLRTERIR